MGYERQADFGAPPGEGPDQVTLSIDGRELTVPDLAALRELMSRGMR